MMRTAPLNLLYRLEEPIKLSRTLRLHPMGKKIEFYKTDEALFLCSINLLEDHQYKSLA